MKYKKYDDINFEPIFEEYKNTKKSFRELEEKYNIPRTTIQTKYDKFINSKLSGGQKKYEKKMTGGNINDDLNISSNNNLNTKNPFEIFERGYKKDDKDVKKTTKQQNNKPTTKRKKIDLEEEYNITKFLKEQDKIKNS